MVWYVIVWNVHNSLLVDKTENHRDKSVIEGKKNYEYFLFNKKLRIFLKFENFQNSRIRSI